MSLFSQIIVGLVLTIIVVATIAAIIYLDKPREWPWKKRKNGGTEDLGESEKTIGMAFHKINVYNPDGSLYKSQKVPEIGQSGYTIGRDKHKDLVVDNSQYVSSDHAVLYYNEKQDKYYIKDTDSKSGTFDSQQRRVGQLVVEDGIEFYIANIRCSFEPCNPFKSEEQKHNKETTMVLDNKEEEEDEYIGTIYI